MPHTEHHCRGDGEEPAWAHLFQVPCFGELTAQVRPPSTGPETFVGFPRQDSQRGDETEGSTIVEVLGHATGDEKSHQVLLGGDFTAMPEAVAVSEGSVRLLKVGGHIPVGHPRRAAGEYIDSPARSGWARRA